MKSPGPARWNGRRERRRTSSWAWDRSSRASGFARLEERQAHAVEACEPEHDEERVLRAEPGLGRLVGFVERMHGLMVAAVADRHGRDAEGHGEIGISTCRIQGRLLPERAERAARDLDDLRVFGRAAR